MNKNLITHEESLMRLLKSPEAIKSYLDAAREEEDPRAYLVAKKNVARVKRVEFLDNLRKPSHKECFNEALETMGSQDFNTIKKETKGVLSFMRMRGVKSEDFSDLLENRLRIIWDISSDG